MAYIIELEKENIRKDLPNCSYERQGLDKYRAMYYSERKTALFDIVVDKKYELKPHHYKLGYEGVHKIACKITQMYHTALMTQSEDREMVEKDGTVKKYKGWTPKEFALLQIYEHAMKYWEGVDRYFTEKARDEGKFDISMQVKNKDLIITDPCYIFNAEKNDYYEKDLKGMIWKNNCYGDWSCTMFEKDMMTEELKPIGKFCADAGAVCIAQTDAEGLDKEKLEKLGSHAYTRICNFTGTASIKYSKEFEDYYVILEGNIYGVPAQFVSRQTGL